MSQPKATKLKTCPCCVNWQDDNRPIEALTGYCKGCWAVYESEQMRKWLEALIKREFVEEEA